MVDTRDLKSLTSRCAGSSPALGTKVRFANQVKNEKLKIKSRGILKK